MECVKSPLSTLERQHGSCLMMLWKTPLKQLPGKGYQLVETTFNLSQSI